jgi:hypothetical protein
MHPSIRRADLASKDVLKPDHDGHDRSRLIRSQIGPPDGTGGGRASAAGQVNSGQRRAVDERWDVNIYFFAFSLRLFIRQVGHWKMFESSEFFCSVFSEIYL